MTSYPDIRNGALDGYSQQADTPAPTTVTMQQDPDPVLMSSAIDPKQRQQMLQRHLMMLREQYVQEAATAAATASAAQQSSASTSTCSPQARAMQSIPSELVGFHDQEIANAAVPIAQQPPYSCPRSCTCDHGTFRYDHQLLDLAVRNRRRLFHDQQERLTEHQQRQATTPAAASTAKHQNIGPCLTGYGCGQAGTDFELGASHMHQQQLLMLRKQQEVDAAAAAAITALKQHFDSTPTCTVSGQGHKGSLSVLGDYMNQLSGMGAQEKQRHIQSESHQQVIRAIRAKQQKARYIEQLEQHEREQSRFHGPSGMAGQPSAYHTTELANVLERHKLQAQIPHAPLQTKRELHEEASVAAQMDEEIRMMSPRMIVLEWEQQRKTMAQQKEQLELQNEQVQQQGKRIEQLEKHMEQLEQQEKQRQLQQKSLEQQKLERQMRKQRPFLPLPRPEVQLIGPLPYHLRGYNQSTGLYGGLSAIPKHAAQGLNWWDSDCKDSDNDEMSSSRNEKGPDPEKSGMDGWVPV
ncbi:hypothetical protein K461DRAFT_304931 [Myriangium duriaei CBS 260.36]|uniref:Uncharacterized protein n=1 Tax=Myriangium duriaei CBS 260.36 TaxID=1168546 RepID=A0A9P4J1K0_9PEZI|nr:hypothetical protein K461DRAFT_304931 [Myriangium duriaei CBS 260.36]